MSKVDLKFSPKGADVVLAMHVDGGKRAEVVMDADALTDLIDKLSKLRSGMSAQVSPTLDPGARLNAVSSPAWAVHPHDQSKLLILRHPGFGWVSFLMPPEEASTLGKALTTGK